MFGVDFVVNIEGMCIYVLIIINGVQDSLENENRVLIFIVNFFVFQEYDLYVCCWVGSGGVNDDSFFYGVIFGEQFFIVDSWVWVNNIYNWGYN